MDKTRKAKRNLQRAMLSLSDAEDYLWLASSLTHGSPAENRIISLVMDVERMRSFVEDEEKRLRKEKAPH